MPMRWTRSGTSSRTDSRRRWAVGSVRCFFPAQVYRASVKPENRDISEGPSPAGDSPSDNVPIFRLYRRSLARAGPRRHLCRRIGKAGVASVQRPCCGVRHGRERSTERAQPKRRQRHRSLQPSLVIGTRHRDVALADGAVGTVARDERASQTAPIDCPAAYVSGAERIEACRSVGGRPGSFSGSMSDAAARTQDRGDAMLSAGPSQMAPRSRSRKGRRKAAEVLQRLFEAR